MFSDRRDRQLPLHSSFIMIESNEHIEPDKRPWLLCRYVSGACFSPNQGHTWLQQLHSMLVRNLGSSVLAQITSERKFLRLMLAMCLAGGNFCMAWKLWCQYHRSLATHGATAGCHIWRGHNAETNPDTPKPWPRFLEGWGSVVLSLIGWNYIIYWVVWLDHFWQGL